MKVRAIHQLLAGFSPGDAISNHARQIQRRLRAWGYESNLYAEHCHPALAGLCEDYHRCPATADSVVILHYSIATRALDFFLHLPGRQVVYYHNITPAHYLHGYNLRIERELESGRAGLAALRHIPYVLAGSEYNAAELARLGFAPATVIPYFIDFEQLRGDGARSPAGREGLARFGGAPEWANLLFVGRIAPNKCQDDLIRLFAYYQHMVRPESRLLLVGSDANGESYRALLEDLVAALGVRDVHFSGYVATEELAAAYATASVFVCLSEHEGFCVPIIEAMAAGIPVLAFAAAAVQDTMGSAGVLVRSKQIEPLAEMVELLVSDPVLRARVIQGQHERVQAFQPQRVEALLRAAIQRIVAD